MYNKIAGWLIICTYNLFLLKEIFSQFKLNILPKQLLQDRTPETLKKKENSKDYSNFSFCNNFFKSHPLQMHQSEGFMQNGKM